MQKNITLTITLTNLSNIVKDVKDRGISISEQLDMLIGQLPALNDFKMELQKLDSSVKSKNQSYPNNITNKPEQIRTAAYLIRTIRNHVSISSKFSSSIYFMRFHLIFRNRTS